MPSAAVSRLRARIGDLGLPGVVWVVEDMRRDVPSVAFYDREKAVAYAAEDRNRYLAGQPLQIRDHR